MTVPRERFGGEQEVGFPGRHFRCKGNQTQYAVLDLTLSAQHCSLFASLPFQISNSPRPFTRKLKTASEGD